MKNLRHLYALTGREGAWRAALRSPPAACRAVTAADADALARLLYEAYLGTIDDEGETPAQAQIEMRGFFAGMYGAPLLDACVAIERDGRPIAAALMCDWNEHHQVVAGPLVAYVIVHPSARGQGHGGDERGADAARRGALGPCLRGDHRGQHALRDAVRQARLQASVALATWSRRSCRRRHRARG